MYQGSSRILLFSLHLLSLVQEVVMIMNVIEVVMHVKLFLHMCFFFNSLYFMFTFDMVQWVHNVFRGGKET
jgi:hypothetical protein